ncbi:MAG: hypothetical protein PF484_12705 [Bacteroidales bacterium]|nr:hypothetical protein [Bacteroidales bacterium]
MYNRNFLKSVLVSSLLLCIVLIANAQTITEEEVTVVAPYSPRIAKAKKIISFPESELNTITKFKLDYYTNPKLISTTFELEELKAARYISPKDPKYKQNIVKGGLGLYITPYAEVFLNKQWNNSLAFGVHAKHLSSNASVENYSSSSFSKTGIDVWSKKTIGKKVFWVSGFYERDAFHYYGFKTREFIWNSDVLPDFDAISAQIFSDVGFNFNIHNIINRKNGNINVNGSYRYFWDKFSNNENLININGVYQRPFNFLGLKNQFVGIGSDIEIAITNWVAPTQIGLGDPTDMVGLSKMKQQIFHGKADLQMFYTIQFDRFDFKAGAVLSAGIDSTSTLIIYPDILLNVNVVKNALDFYVKLDGGLISPSYYSISRENPYVSAFIPLKYSSRTFRLKGGLTANLGGIADFHLWGSTEGLNNDVFFTTDTSRVYNNQFKLIYDSVEVLKIGSDLRIRLGEAFVGFQLIYQKYSMAKEEYAWYKPNWSWNISADYWLYDNLKLSLVLKGQSEVWGIEGKVKRKIGSWSDLSLGANYHFDHNLSAFINLNNILNHNYQQWYNYPVKGFGAMIGVNYAF